MRKVVVYELMSLDGVAEEPGDWLLEVDAEIVENLGRVIETQDVALLGRVTYDYWVGYWPTSEVEPFASFINGTAKHVFTSAGRPDGHGEGWPNAVFVDTPLVEHVRALKDGDGGDIGVHGSLSVVRALLAADLVDELHLVVAPALAGRGRRLFAEAEGLRRLELTDAQRTPSGALLLHYVVPASS